MKPTSCLICLAGLTHFPGELGTGHFTDTRSTDTTAEQFVKVVAHYFQTEHSAAPPEGLLEAVYIRDKDAYVKVALAYIRELSVASQTANAAKAAADDAEEAAKAADAVAEAAEDAAEEAARAADAAKVAADAAVKAAFAALDDAEAEKEAAAKAARKAAAKATDATEAALKLVPFSRNLIKVCEDDLVLLALVKQYQVTDLYATLTQPPPANLSGTRSSYMPNWA